MAINNPMHSLDPRVNRLPNQTSSGAQKKQPLDQFQTFEVFVEPKPGKPFQHEGILHAPDLEMAFVLAKETFTRRFTCSSLYVLSTADVWVSPMTDGKRSAYDLINYPEANGDVEYEIYHLLKRGKQHVFAGSVRASSPEGALAAAKQRFGTTLVCNIWAIRSRDIRRTSPEEGDLWITLPEKKFRDASDYKGGDKLKDFVEKKSVSK